MGIFVNSTPYPLIGTATTLSCTFSIPITPGGQYVFGVIFRAGATVNYNNVALVGNTGMLTVGGAAQTGVPSITGPGGNISQSLTPAQISAVAASAGGPVAMTFVFNSTLGVADNWNATLEIAYQFGSGGGGGGIVISFGCSASSPDANGSSLITVVLKDGSGNPAPAPAGGQTFTLSTTGGIVTPTTLIIAEGASTGYATATNPTPGTTTVTIVAGAGPVSGQANCVCSFSVSNTVATGNTPDLCLLKVTRPNLRDSIRIMLGITPPISIIPGALPGEEPAGESYPGNMVLNQAIADAIRDINRECDFHSSMALTINVPATTTSGPQFLALQGVGAGPYQSIINTVKRAVWDDGNGNLTRLLPRSLWDMDRQRRAFDMETPDTPREFVIEAYQLGLLPGSSAGGTVRLYAGTGLLGFCSDVDTLDELPIDYQAVVEYWAVVHLCMNQSDDPKFQNYLKTYMPLAQKGIEQILRWLRTVNAEEQSSMVYRSARRNRWR